MIVNGKSFVGILYWHFGAITQEELVQYTTLGKTGLKVSRLGFGCMRLPMKSEKEIDRALAIPLLHRAVDLGITYFDTAVGYCAGDSQRVVGEAFESMRDRVMISTKNHHFDKDDKDGWWKNLHDSLERLRTDHIDVYNFHGMNYERYEAGLAGEDGLYKEILRAREQGMVHHICHSFHGSLDSLKKCIDTGLFESVTVQYNLLDQSLEEGVALAAEHDMGVVIMGPVGGGRLGYPTGKAQDIAGEVKSTPELALRFVLSNQNVNVALSGMSSMEQLEENVETLTNLGELTSEDHNRIEAAVLERKELAGLYCTGCNYCLPCPDGVDIPANFEILNLERVFGLSEHARSRYATLGGKAALCRQCGKCVELCPQELDIPTRLGESVSLLDDRSGSVAGWTEIQSGRIEEDGMLSMSLRYHVKNFSDQKYDSVDVQLHSHREEQIAPAKFNMSNLKGFGRRHRDLIVRSRAPIESMSIDSIIEFDGSHTLEHLSYVLSSAIYQSASENIDSPLARPDGPTVHVPAPIHPVHTFQQTVKSHSYDFAVRYDAENLYVWADVEDDLLHIAQTAPTGAISSDNFRVYLDARPVEKQGIGGYEDGVLNVTFCLVADGVSHIAASNGADIEGHLERTDYGYVLSCRLPWSVFGSDAAPPGLIGFDTAQVSYAHDGTQLLRMSWTGRDGQEQDTTRFGKMLLV